MHRTPSGKKLGCSGCIAVILLINGVAGIAGAIFGFDKTESIPVRHGSLPIVVSANTEERKEFAFIGVVSLAIAGAMLARWFSQKTP